MAKKISKKQLAANRRNAKRSTGPCTPQGKAIVSKNGLKNGFSSDQIVIKSEDRAQFDLHRSQMIEELAPDTPVESYLADRIVKLSWKLQRIDYIQNQTIDALAAPKTGPLAKFQQALLAKYAPETLTETSKPDPKLALGRLAIKDFSNSRVLERLLMYERRTESSLYKTLLELQRLKMIKKLKDAQDPALEL
jgi:hypothetical protein